MLLICVCRCPEQVMLCILPKVSDGDTLVNIQHKLIEAHCWENDVNLVKVRTYLKPLGANARNGKVIRNDS